MDDEGLGRVEEGSHPDCRNASNPYHQCNEYCFKMIAESKNRTNQHHSGTTRTKLNLSRPGWFKEEYEVENQSGPAMRRYETLKFALEIRDLGSSRSLKQARGDMKIDLRKLDAAYRSKQLKRKSQVEASSLKNFEKKSATESGHALFIAEKMTKPLTIPQPAVTSNPSATAVPEAVTTPALTEARSQSMVDAFLSLERRFLSEPPIVDPNPLVTECFMLQRRRAELAYDEYVFYQNLAACEDERTREVKNALAARDEAIESKLKAEAATKEAEDNFKAATKALDVVNGFLVESQLKVEELKRQVAIERESRNEYVRSLENKINMLEGDLVSARAGIDLDWPSILKGKEFAPIRDTIFQVAVNQVRETLQKAHPGIDLTCLLDFEEGEAMNVEHSAGNQEIETSARKEVVTKKP